MYVCVCVLIIFIYWGYIGVDVEVREQHEPFVPFFHHMGLQLDLRWSGSTAPLPAELSHWPHIVSSSQKDLELTTC